MTGEAAIVSGEARLRIVSVGPFVTFQDGGRRGHMRFGVARSGPMDEVAHALGNLALGNDAGATAIEVSRAGLDLEVVTGSVTVATTGGDASVERNGRPIDHWHATTLHPGDRFTVRQGSSGSWSYLTVAGDLLAPVWLGHTATHSTSGLGGGQLVAGEELVVSASRVDDPRTGEIPRLDEDPSAPIRVVVGPQHRHFPSSVVETFTGSPYRLTDAYDRMGVRLDGPPVIPEHALSIPSEPIVRGSIQVSGDGVPTVLLADHQTTGGYPKIATVVSADLDRFVQFRAGDEVTFDAVASAEAIEFTRRRAAAVTTLLDRVAGPGRTVAHRLREANLVGGVISPCDL